MFINSFCFLQWVVDSDKLVVIRTIHLSLSTVHWRKKALPRIAFREHNFTRLGVQTVEHFLYEACFHRAGVSWFDKVSADGLDPGIVAYAEDDGRVFAHFELVYGGLGEEFAVGAHPFHHRF